MSTSQKYQLQLTWLNSLGGWEYWNFLAKKTEGYDIDDSKTVERDVLQNWDTDFIAGDTEQETLFIAARRKVVVRTQLLTLQQINAIAKINLSIRVRDVLNDVTVTIDRSSFEYRTDGEKLHSLEFAINYPRTQIQSL